VLVLALSSIDLLMPCPQLDWLIAILEAAFYFYAAASLIAYMYRTSTPAPMSCMQ